jgi:hypothetical protein
MRRAIVPIGFAFLLILNGIIYKDLIEIKKAVEDGKNSIYTNLIGQTEQNSFASADLITDLNPILFGSAVGELSKADIKGATVDVRDFGARGDGVTDDTEAVQRAIDALGANGGTILLKGKTVLNASSLAYRNTTGNWLIFKVYGELRLTSTFKASDFIALVGENGGGVLQFQVQPSALITPPLGSVPTIKITGSNYHLLKNLQIKNPTGIGILLDGTAALGALAWIENVGVLGSTASTSSPIKIDAFFWVWIKNCVFMSRSNNPSIYITTSNSTYSGSGLIYIDDIRIAARGIKIGATTRVNGQGAIYINGVVYESGLELFLTLDGSNGVVSHVELNKVEIADPISVRSVMDVISGPVKNIAIRNTNFPLIPLVSGNAQIDGLFWNSGRGFDYTQGWNLGIQKSNYILLRNGIVHASFINRGATMSPSLLPYGSLNIDQDVSTWSAKTGTATVTIGIPGPDGSATAAKLTSSLGEQYREIFRQNRAFNVGDWILTGVWVRSENASTTPYYLSLMGFTNPNFTFQGGSQYIFYTTDAAKQIGSRWVPIVLGGKVATVGTPNNTELILQLKADTTHPTSYWVPWIIHIPVSAGISDDEVYRWMRDIVTNVPSNAPAGAIAMFPHQKLWGASLIGSRGISATATSANNLRGFVTISDTATSGTAIFLTPEPDANYFLTLTPTTVIGTPAYGSNRIRSINKTKEGFTVMLESAPGKGNKVTFDWHLIR